MEEGNSGISYEDRLNEFAQQERERVTRDKPRAKNTARLIWASKPRKEPSAKDLEFQTAEEVYPSPAEKTDKKNRSLSTFTSDKPKISEHPNRLIWGDNLLVMQALLAQGYEGQIDLIYIDPPFNSEANYNFSSKLEMGNTLFEKELPINERLAYTDTWSRGIDSFLDMLYIRIQLIHKLLSPKGNIFLHCDWHIGHYIKIILDEIFGIGNFQNEIIWHYDDKFATGGAKLDHNHDVIFHYSKTPSYVINPLMVSKEEPTKRALRKKVAGKTIDVRDDDGNKIWVEYTEKKIDDVWKIPKTMSDSERTGYGTQKPEKLLSRIIAFGSGYGDLVADFFCGGGTTAAVAEKLGRRWITSDLSKTALQVARNRLVNQGSKPFVIENLGNYQRQLIYNKEVNLKQMYNIVLKIARAKQRDDLQGFGVQDDGKTLIYVSEPDRPLTARKAKELGQLAKQLDGKGYKKLIILAWDYAYDFDDAWIKEKNNAKKALVDDIECKLIPSDVYKYLRNTKISDQSLADKIQFHQKPYLRMDTLKVIAKSGDDITVQIKIGQYVLYDIPLKDEDKRSELETLMAKNFACLIDFWAVDWDYNNEVFRSQWQAIRDRKSASPVPITAEATLKKGKKYRIAVRLVDVFGNDACVTQEIDLI